MCLAFCWRDAVADQLLQACQIIGFGVGLHLGDPDVSAAAPLALHGVAMFIGETGLYHVVQLRGDTVEFLCDMRAFYLHDFTAGFFNQLFEVLFDYIRHVAHYITPFDLL